LRKEIEALARRARVDLVDATEETTEPAAPLPMDEFGLTAREVDVLRLLAEGKTNPEIAETLFISRKTASIHVSHILAKLGVATRVEAAGVAHRAGLLERLDNEVDAAR
jgi:DNA-binding NarL/FixJ family response regulator